MDEITTWEEAKDSFNEFLNDTHSWPLIAGIEFAPSDILKEVDPVAYRCYLADYLDGEGIDSDTFTD